MFGRARWLALALLVTRPAMAQTDPVLAAAREHFSAGIKLYDKGDYEGALVEFRAAHSARSQPQILVNIGLCLRALGRNAEAIETLEPLLDDPKIDEPTRTATQRTLAELRAKTATIRIRIVLNVAPGARAPEPVVSIDGAPIEPKKALQTIWLDPGPHRVAARAIGFPEVSSEVTLSAGDRDIAVDLSLVATQTAPEPKLDVKVAPKPLPPPLSITADKKWYLGASVGFFGGELPVRSDQGGPQGLLGVMFVGRLGRRFGNHLSIEIDGELMGAGTREYQIDPMTATKRSYAVSHVALGAGPRIVTSTSSPRFTAAGIGGVVNQKITRDEHPAGAANATNGAPTGYLQIEAGIQIDAGAITLEGVGFIGMLGLNSDDYLSAQHTVMTRYGAKVALQFSF